MYSISRRCKNGSPVALNEGFEVLVSYVKIVGSRLKAFIFLYVNNSDKTKQGLSGPARIIRKLTPVLYGRFTTLSRVKLCYQDQLKTSTV